MEVQFEMALTHHEISLLGGKAFGEKSRKEAIERYYLDPNYCKQCGDMIHPKEGQRGATCEARRKKFCNSACAASYNNAQYPKRKAISQGVCERCGALVVYKKQKDGRHSRRQFCDSCLSKVRSEKAKAMIRTRGFRTLSCSLENCTKAELREKSPNYNYFGSRIATHARRVYNNSSRPKICRACGYSYHVDICHIKDVSKFDGSATIGEINDISNLVTLCKNHHKEFDDGVLILDKGASSSG